MLYHMMTMPASATRAVSLETKKKQLLTEQVLHIVLTIVSTWLGGY